MAHLHTFLCSLPAIEFVYFYIYIYISLIHTASDARNKVLSFWDVDIYYETQLLAGLLRTRWQMLEWNCRAVLFLHLR